MGAEKNVAPLMFPFITLFPLKFFVTTLLFPSAPQIRKVLAENWVIKDKIQVFSNQILFSFLLFKVHLDSHGPHSPNSPDGKEHDFFKEVENQSFSQTVSIPTNGKNNHRNDGMFNAL